MPTELYDLSEQTRKENKNRMWVFIVSLSSLQMSWSKLGNSMYAYAVSSLVLDSKNGLQQLQLQGSCLSTSRPSFDAQPKQL